MKWKETEIGRIPEDWDLFKLSDLTSKITKGTTPTTLGCKFVKKGVDFIKAESLNDDGTMNPEKFMHIDEETNKMLSRSQLQKNDLLYTIAGTIGRVSIVKTNILPANTNQAVAILRPNLKKVNLFYLRYVLASPAIKTYLLSKEVHAVQANLSLTELGNCPIPTPNKVEQQAIAKILLDLDSKIELNNQMNATLEAMAQAIFKHWFVDFEFSNEEGKPYRSNGGKIVDNKELGKRIPLIWKSGKYSDLVTVSTGKGLKRNDFVENGQFPVIGANGELGRTNKFSSNGAVILTGRVGTLGTVYLIHNKAWISDNVLISRPIYYENYYYSYFTIKTFNFESLNRGSTQPLVTQTDLKNQIIMIPDKRILHLYNDICSKLFDIIYQNKDTNENLIQIRDSLLPKLMSGQIRVNGGS